MKTFLEFLKIREAGGLFTTGGWPADDPYKPGVDLYLKKYGGPQGAAGQASGAALFPNATSAPSTQGGQPTKRMKKMKKP